MAKYRMRFGNILSYETGRTYDFEAENNEEAMKKFMEEGNLKSHEWDLKILDKIVVEEQIVQLRMMEGPRIFE